MTQFRRTDRQGLSNKLQIFSRVAGGGLNILLAVV